MRRICAIALFALLWLSSLSGCQNAAATDAATPMPTATPDDRAFLTLENPVAGVTFEYPADWYISTSTTNNIATPEERVIKDDDLGLGAFFMTISGSPEQLAQIGVGGNSSAEALSHFHSGVANAPGFMLTKPPFERPLAGQPAQAEIVSLEMLPGHVFRLLLLTYVGDETAIAGMIGAPEGQWAEMLPTFERMLDSLTLSPPQPPVEVDSGELTVDASAEGELHLGETDVWIIQSQGNALYFLEVAAIDGDWDPYMVIEDAGGEVVAANDDATVKTRDARIAGLWLPRPGSYQVKVYTRTGAGRYRVTLKPALDLSHKLPASGQSEGALGNPSERHIWEFEGHAGETVNILVDGKGFDGYLELYGPDGARLAEDDDSGGGTDAQVKAPLPKDGTYFILLYARDAATATGGDYTVQITYE